MLEPIKYEIPFIMPNKEKLEELNNGLYKLDELVERNKQEIEQKMYDYLYKKDKQRVLKGRKGYPLLLRFKVLLLMHREDLTLREMEQFIKENISVRLYLDMEEFECKTPSYVIIHEWNKEFDEEFIKGLNQLLVIQEGIKQKKVLGRKSRTDTTVIEENVGYPTDSGLLKKGKDLLVKGAKKLKEICGKKFDKGSKKVIKGTRKLKKIYYDIKKYARKRGEEGQEKIKAEYKKMINSSKTSYNAMVKYIKEIKSRTKKVSKNVKEKLQNEINNIEEILGKYAQIIKQTEKRVIDGKTVGMGEKILSFVSDTATIICKGKENKTREIGQKLSITEVENGVISNWEVYEGNPSDKKLLARSLEECEKSLGKMPKNNAFDRGYWDKKEIERIEKEKNISLHIPKQGKKNEEDKKREGTRKFKKYQKFRSGGEGRISLLKRRAGLRRLRVRGGKSTQIKIGWGILADNLRIIA